MEDRLQINPFLVVVFFKKQVWVKLFGIHALTASLLFIFFILNSISVPAQPVDHLVLHQGTLKLLRDGRSHLLWKPRLKLRLLKGDRLHTGSGARVSLKFMQESENIELFSHTFFAVEGIAEEQRNMALLMGKGNFALPPAPQKEIEETPEKKVKQASEEIEQEKSTISLSEAKEPQKESKEISGKSKDNQISS